MLPSVAIGLKIEKGRYDRDVGQVVSGRFIQHIQDQIVLDSGERIFLIMP
jgi:hypothetical protein